MKSKMIKFLMVAAMLVGGSFFAMETAQAVSVSKSYACAVNIGVGPFSKPGGCASGDITNCMTFYNTAEDDSANFAAFKTANPNCAAKFMQTCKGDCNSSTYCQYAAPATCGAAPAPAPASGPCDSPCSARSDRTACVAAVKADSSTVAGDACKAYLCGVNSSSKGKSGFSDWANANC